MTSPAPDRSWIVVAIGLVATAIVAAALGAVVTLWLVDRPIAVPAPKQAAALPAAKPVTIPTPVPAAVPVPVPAPAPDPAPVASPAPVAAADPTPAPAPAPPMPPPAADPPAKPVAAAKPPVDGNAIAAKQPFAVQIGAFEDLDHAQTLAKDLTDQGYPSQVEDHKAPSGHDMHYVRLADGFGTRGEAARAAAGLKRKLDVDAIPIRRQGAEAAP